MLMLKNENKPATAETRPLVAGDPFWEEREETYHATRQYLVRVRELTQKIALLKNRIAYREDNLFSDDSLGVVGKDSSAFQGHEAERGLQKQRLRNRDVRRRQILYCHRQEDRWRTGRDCRGQRYARMDS